MAALSVNVSRWNGAHVQLRGLQPGRQPAGQRGRRPRLHADGVELEAGGGDAELQGRLPGGLPGQLLPTQPGSAHLLRLRTHQVRSRPDPLTAQFSFLPLGGFQRTTQAILMRKTKIIQNLMRIFKNQVIENE